VIFCGDASGNYLSPMIIYQSDHMSAEWCNGGPQGCFYNCTEKGSIDARTFRIWFDKVIPQIYTEN